MFASEDFPLNPGISLIPKDYKLRFSSRFLINNLSDYIIEQPTSVDFVQQKNPENQTEVKNYSDEMNENHSQKTVTTRNPDKTWVGAEMISNRMTWSSWVSAKYQIREKHNDTTGNETYFLTANASTKFWTYYSTVFVDFTSTDQLEADDFRACRYQLVWRWIASGSISRQCPNLGETSFQQVSFVSGTGLFGLDFFDVSGTVKFAVVSRPDFSWDGLQSRQIVVYPEASFSPLIPSIYTAFNNYYYSKKSSYRNRKIQNKS
ncbi:hypothetical protein G9A89_021121 [Geosiphon pyriformis]|nr:hypothetical protein G9A89_021121 [Geosiphon pyriformis]